MKVNHQYNEKCFLYTVGPPGKWKGYSSLLNKLSPRPINGHYFAARSCQCDPSIIRLYCVDDNEMIG